MATQAMGRNIGVYCGSSSGLTPEFAAEAVALGSALVTGGHGLVYGGGRIGLMGLIADSVLDNGGQVHGVIPEHLVKAETAHQGLTTLEIVKVDGKLRNLDVTSTRNDSSSEDFL